MKKNPFSSEEKSSEEYSWFLMINFWKARLLQLKNCDTGYSLELDTLQKFDICIWKCIQLFFEYLNLVHKSRQEFDYQRKRVKLWNDR